MSRQRNYVFTINNYDDASITQIKCLPYKYLCFGREIAPTTGTPHLQGFVCLRDGCTVTALRKKLVGAHVEVMRGKIEQNERYCSKSGNYEEYGTKPMTQEGKGEAERQRWQEAYEAAEAGEWNNVPEDMKIRYTGNLKKIESGCFKKQKLEDTEDQMLWLVGPPGSGKSRFAREEYPEHYIKMLNKWWDGYNDEPFVIIDDVAPPHREILDMLKVWGDRYPFRSEFKGSSKMMRPKKIIVTSNYTIGELYNTVDLEAMKRRFKIVQFPLTQTK